MKIARGIRPAACTMMLQLLLLAVAAVHSFHVSPRSAFVGSTVSRHRGPFSPSTARQQHGSHTPVAESKRYRPFPLLHMADTPPDDASMNDPNQEDETPERVQANFDNLFEGMPNINHILGDDDSLTPQDSSDSRIPDVGGGEQQASTPREIDDTWFEPIQREIEKKYAELKVVMQQQLDELIKTDPDSVPENAQLVMETILQREMEADIESKRAQAAKELLVDYESEERDYADTRDLSGTEDSEVAQRLQKELKEKQEQQAAVQARIDEFMKYEEESFRRAAEKEVVVPDDGEDLDDWALERLEEMLSTHSEDVSVMDNLEDNVRELRERIEKEKQRGSIRPETLKEWQMYRSIATRMLEDQAATTSEEKQELVEDEDAISSQLESWKTFQAKESTIRRQSGLASGPKMPFEWQEAGKDPLADLEEETAPEDGRSRSEIRAEVNQKAIEALEDLVRRNEGTPRGESLQQSLDYLKTAVEEGLDVEADEELSESPTGPVDVSDVFAKPQSEKQASAGPRTAPIETEESKPLSPPDTPFFSGPEDEPVGATPPDTPFFSSGEQTVADTSNSQPPPPDTPFFSGGDDENVSIEPEVLDSSKLGTIDEQKLRTMYRRAGAVTEEEQAKIRQQWEEFQRIEKQKRDSSGLSDRQDSDSLSEASLDYDISEVMKDGDIDAEKVLSKIGPRPTRKGDKKGATGVARGGADASVLDAGKEEKASQAETDAVSDPLFRSVSAVGGGRTKDDPEAKAREKSAFEKFVHREDEIRDNLSDLDESLARNTTSDELGTQEGSSESLDDVTYAKEALASMGPRPTRERKRTAADMEREYSESGGVFKDKDSDDETMGTESEKRPSGRGGFLGDEVVDSEDEDYEKNMRQLREYEERRGSKRPRQMGIDISEVLGRSDTYADDDYDNDRYRRDESTSSGWERGRSFSSFGSRKANLLDYTELNVAELNSLMDHKGSVLATGVSQYMPRINKPFREFGAIFRLEGVLLDTTGLQYEAWKKTAEAHGFKPPRLEDVRLAAVANPEIVPRKIFFWTDDFVLCKAIARTHTGSMRAVFSNWMQENDVTYSAPKHDETLVENVEYEESARTPVVAVENEANVEKQLGAWALTAEQFGFLPPSLDEVMFASVISKEDAVTNAFRWTTDESKVSQIVKAYLGFLTESTGTDDSSVPEVSTTPANEPAASTGPADKPGLLTENEMIEIQYKAWLAVAENHCLDPPTPDEAYGAMVINDPALIVREGFAWTEDPVLVKEWVREYETNVRKLVLEHSGGGGATNFAPVARDESSATSTKAAQESEKQSGPTKEELEEMKIYSWATAAEKYDYDASYEQVQAALLVDPEEAIRRVFGWTEDENRVQELASIYRTDLESRAKKFNLKVGPASPKVTPSSQSQPKGPSNEELFQAASDAWKQVAERRRYPPPNADQVQLSMTVGPQDALVSFQWTEDPEERQHILEDYLEAVKGTSSKMKSGATLGLEPKTQASPIDDAPPPYSVIPGASKWLQSLLDVEMHCGVISYLDRDQVDILLEHSKLDRYFPRDKRVTAGNGYELASQQMLGAALRVERRPDHCVVFEASPEGAAAAHDVDMKSVAMIGVYPMYDLLNADSTARYLDELTAMNVRRLFAENVYDKPLFDAIEERPDVKRQTKTRFWEEGDRA